MELRRTLQRHHDDVQGPRIRYPGPIRDPEWRSDTDAIFSERQKMELAGTRPTHARAPPGAPSHAKLRQTYPRDAFRRRTKSKYLKRYKHVLRIGSYGVAIGLHCVANLYKGEFAKK